MEDQELGLEKGDGFCVEAVFLLFLRSYESHESHRQLCCETVAEIAAWSGSGERISDGTNWHASLNGESHGASHGMDYD